MNDADEVIAKRVQEGNVEAFGELVVRYEDKLKRYAKKFLTSREDIDDLVQDVFIKAYGSIQSFDTSLRFSPWMYRIAHNTFVNELRRKERMGYGIFNTDTILPFLEARERSDAEAHSRELQEELDALLITLPAKYREVIILHYLEGLAYEEIGEILHIPVTTVGVRLTRARRILKEKAVAKHITP